MTSSLKLPSEFAKKIIDTLDFKEGIIPEWFDIGETKEGYFYARLQPKKWLSDLQFKAMCALTRDLDGEYVKGEKTFKVPGPMAKKGPTASEQKPSGQGIDSQPTYKQPGTALLGAEAAKARRDSGEFFENLAIQILSKLGFTKIVKEKKSQPYDIEAEKDGKKCFVEVKGRTVDRLVDVTPYLIQYEKLWNLIKVAEKGQVYFLFLTNTDSKLVKYEDLTSEYMKKYKLTLTVKEGSRIDRWLKDERLLGGADRFVVINDLLSMPFQSRKSEDPEIDQLVESIKRYGVLAPILVRQKGGALFEVVAGERRLAAAKRAGLTKVPAIIKELTDEEALVLQLTENLQRKDLTEEEKRGALAELVRRTGWNAQQIADNLKMSERWVYKYLPSELKGPEPEQLTKGREESQESIYSARRALNNESQESIQSCNLTEHQAREILAAPEEKREEILSKIKETGQVPSGREIHAAAKSVPCARCGEAVEHPVNLEGKFYCAACAEAVVEEAKKGLIPGAHVGPLDEELRRALHQPAVKPEVPSGPTEPSPAEKAVLKAVPIGEFDCTECHKHFLVEHLPDGEHKLRFVREAPG